MKLYADISWWLGYKCRADVQHNAAITLFDRHEDAEVLWTPWQRVEVFNALCQAERASLLPTGESRQIIRLLEQEIRIGYWPHVEFDGRMQSGLQGSFGLSTLCVSYSWDGFVPCRDRD